MRLSGADWDQYGQECYVSTHDLCWANSGSVVQRQTGLILLEKARAAHLAKVMRTNFAVQRELQFDRPDNDRWRMNLYQTTASVAPSYKLLGCYTDSETRALPAFSIVDTVGMTVKKCQDTCSSKGYSLAGVQYGTVGSKPRALVDLRNATVTTLSRLEMDKVSRSRIASAQLRARETAPRQTAGE